MTSFGGSFGATGTQEVFFGTWDAMIPSPKRVSVGLAAMTNVVLFFLAHISTNSSSFSEFSLGFLLGTAFPIAISENSIASAIMIYLAESNKNDLRGQISPDLCRYVLTKYPHNLIHEF